MATMPSALSWPGATGTNLPSGINSAGGAAWNVGQGTSPFQPTPAYTGNVGTTPIHPSRVNRALGQQNLISQQYRNFLTPEFANAMFGYAGPVGDYYRQLMNLGSPYYQQQQRASFEQGVGQGQNAAAGSRQALGATGYGSAPSGLEAGMLGQEATGQTQNLTNTFLQNLFQNEQLQMQAATGMQNLAGMFNPAQLIAGTSYVPYSPSFFTQLTQGLGALGAGVGTAATGIT